VVAEGVTFTDVPLTAPTEGLMVRPGEPVTVQLSVVDCPGVSVAGVALKLVMVGGVPDAGSGTAAPLPPRDCPDSDTPATARNATAAIFMIRAYRPVPEDL
jgi:hypothetical protein